MGNKQYIVRDLKVIGSVCILFGMSYVFVKNKKNQDWFQSQRRSKKMSISKSSHKWVQISIALLQTCAGLLVNRLFPQHLHQFYLQLTLFNLHTFVYFYMKKAYLSILNLLNIQAQMLRLLMNVGFEVRCFRLWLLPLFFTPILLHINYLMIF